MTRTGIYRVRKTWWGKCILQEYIDTPSFIGGKVDASIRKCTWADTPYNNAPTQLKIDNINKNKSETMHRAGE